MRTEEEAKIIARRHDDLIGRNIKIAEENGILISTALMGDPSFIKCAWRNPPQDVLLAEIYGKRLDDYGDDDGE